MSVVHAITSQDYRLKITVERPKKRVRYGAGWRNPTAASLRRLMRVIGDWPTTVSLDDKGPVVRFYSPPGADNEPVDPTENCPHCGSDNISTNWPHSLHFPASPDLWECDDCGDRWEVGTGVNND